MLQNIFDYSKLIIECQDAMKNAKCAKKHLGCVLILKDGKHIQGWNGPPDQLASCNPCPRLNSHGATDLHLCKAVHAERKTLLTCAKYGYSTKGAVLYSYMGVPCKDCLVELIEAGVEELICIRDTYYDYLSKEILSEWIQNGGKFKVIPIEDV